MSEDLIRWTAEGGEEPDRGVWRWTAAQWSWAVTHPHVEIRRLTAHRIGLPPRWRGVLARDHNERVRLALLESKDKYGEDVWSPEMTPLLSDPSPNVRRRLLQWSCLPPEEIDKFRHDPDPRVRADTLAAFTHAGQTGPGQLLRLLLDPDAGVRTDSVAAIDESAWHVRQHSIALVAGSRDPSPSVRRQAQHQIAPDSSKSASVPTDVEATPSPAVLIWHRALAQWHDAIGLRRSDTYTAVEWSGRVSALAQGLTESGVAPHHGETLHNSLLALHPSSWQQWLRTPDWRVPSPETITTWLGDVVASRAVLGTPALLKGFCAFLAEGGDIARGYANAMASSPGLTPEGIDACAQIATQLGIGNARIRVVQTHRARVSPDTAVLLSQDVVAQVRSTMLSRRRRRSLKLLHSVLCAPSLQLESAHDLLETYRHPRGGLLPVAICAQLHPDLTVPHELFERWGTTWGRLPHARQRTLLLSQHRQVREWMVRSLRRDQAEHTHSTHTVSSVSSIGSRK